MNIAWFSCGVTSAVMCKILVAQFLPRDLEIVYIDTGSEHESNKKFLDDCQKWFKFKNIQVIKSMFYKDHWAVIEQTKFINGPFGAACTRKLKREARAQYEYGLKLRGINVETHFYGFDSSENKRAERFLKSNPTADFPLIKSGIGKEDCFKTINEAGIELPTMYKLGYGHNNCIGCVKGGKKYWRMIKRDFPEAFQKMMILEASIKHSCIKGCFLKDLQDGEMGPEEISCGPDCKGFEQGLFK